MKHKRFTEEQIIGILNEAEQAGNIREVCKLNNITEQSGRRLGEASRLLAAGPRLMLT